MSIQPIERLQQAFTVALEDRNKNIVDVVASANLLLTMMQENGQLKSFEGPAITQPIRYDAAGSYRGATDFAQLDIAYREILASAEWRPKAAYVSFSLSNLQLLRSSGKSQIINLFDTYLKFAMDDLKDGIYVDLHSDGTGYGGQQITGLNAALPIINNVGVYGGIDRAQVLAWRPGSYNIQTDFPTVGTQFTPTTAQTIIDLIVADRTRGTMGPDLMIACMDHWIAIHSSMKAIQRINDQNNKGVAGFMALEYHTAGRKLKIGVDSGYKNVMPANTSYFVNTNQLQLRYHPDRNFSRIGGKQMPINQDAIVQHLGFFGELTMESPLHMARLYDSNPAA